MNDFDFDCKEKKAIARSAFHKKNGSKSKGCHLPSDDLSAAQRKKLNGPCKIVSLHQPMTWAEFKSLPHDIQQKYYDECFDTYGPSLCAFAKMLGVGEPAIAKHFKANDLKLRNDARYRMTKIQKEMWTAFCNGVVGGGPNETRINVAPDVSIPVAPLPEYQDPQIIPQAVTISDNSKDLEQIRFERDFYKERYFELIAILGERK